MNKLQQVPNQYSVGPKPVHNYGTQDINRQYPTDQNQRQYMGAQPQNGQYSTNGPQVERQYSHDGMISHRNQNGNDANIQDGAPNRGLIAEEGYRESPPPPLNTSTHPLYNKQTTDSRFVNYFHFVFAFFLLFSKSCIVSRSNRVIVESKRFSNSKDYLFEIIYIHNRYTASMQDPPRGGYYPVGTTQQPRQYQFNASNPWQREEREKVMYSFVP